MLLCKAVSCCSAPALIVLGSGHIWAGPALSRKPRRAEPAVKASPASPIAFTADAVRSTRGCGGLRTETTAVVGGGCAGVLVAGHLVHGSEQNVVLIDPSPQLGTGVAYGSAAPWHLLNSPAAAMSADATRPQDFLEWLRRGGKTAVPGDFVPRTVYGDYLRATLDQAATGGRLQVRRSEVLNVAPRDDEVQLAFDAGADTRVDHVVLALGNPAATAVKGLAPGLHDHPGYVGDPWLPGALDHIDPAAPTLLVGAGLTAVDVAASLARTARTAPLTAVSRRGLLPRTHLPPALAGPKLDRALQARTLRELLRAFRARLDEAEDWRSVMDGLRGQTNSLWSALSLEDQRRFLRHGMRRWEVHRHRMAPEAAEQIEQMRRDGELSVAVDGVRSITAVGADRLQVAFDSGDTCCVGAVVNCTGPGLLPGAGNALTRRLLHDGVARPGPHHMGLDVDAVGRVVGRDGRVWQRLHVVGPLRRGRLWETTAVPEIRDQAAALAARHAQPA